MTATLRQIHEEGLRALRDRLGRAGMLRFLQRFQTGHGDYARERHEWVDRTTLDDIREAAARLRKAGGNGKRHSRKRKGG